MGGGRQGGKEGGRREEEGRREEGGRSCEYIEEGERCFTMQETSQKHQANSKCCLPVVAEQPEIWSKPISL